MEDRSPEDKTPKGGLMKLKDGHYIDSVGYEVWVQDGEYHRLDGPAIIYENGSRWWYNRGKIHREDGPAIIRGQSILWSFLGSTQVIMDTKEYWLDGVRYKDELRWRIEAQKWKRQKEEED